MSASTNLFDSLTIVLMILAGRFLGEAQFGMLSFAQSLALVCMGLGNSGLAALMTNDVPRHPESAGEKFALVVPWALFATACIGVAMVAGTWLAYPDQTLLVGVVAVMGGSTLFRGIVVLLRCFLRGLQRFDLELRAVVLENAVLIPAAVVVLLAGGGVLAVAMAMLAGRFAGLLFHLAALRREFPLRPRIAPRALLPIARAAFPVGVSQALFMMVQQVDNLVLALFVSFAAIGEFNAAMKIYVGCMMFPAIVASVLLPRLSASAMVSRDTHNGFLVLSVLALALIALMGILLGVPLSGFTIHTLYGASYDRAAPILEILVVAMLPAFQVHFLRIYLLVIDRKAMMIAFSIFGLIVRLTCAFVLIPQYGIYGSAVSILISESILAAALWVYLFRAQLKIGSVRQLEARLRDAFAALS